MTIYSNYSEEVQQTTEAKPLLARSCTVDSTDSAVDFLKYGRQYVEEEREKTCVVADEGAGIYKNGYDKDGNDLNNPVQRFFLDFQNEHGAIPTCLLYWAFLILFIVSGALLCFLLHFTGRTCCIVRKFATAAPSTTAVPISSIRSSADVAVDSTTTGPSTAAVPTIAPAEYLETKNTTVIKVMPIEGDTECNTPNNDYSECLEEAKKHCGLACQHIYIYLVPKTGFHHYRLYDSNADKFYGLKVDGAPEGFSLWTKIISSDEIEYELGDKDTGKCPLDFEHFHTNNEDFLQYSNNKLLVKGDAMSAFGQGIGVWDLKHSQINCHPNWPLKGWFMHLEGHNRLHYSTCSGENGEQPDANHRRLCKRIKKSTVTAI